MQKLMTCDLLNSTYNIFYFIHVILYASHMVRSNVYILYNIIYFHLKSLETFLKIIITVWCHCRTTYFLKNCSQFVIAIIDSKSFLCIMIFLLCCFRLYLVKPKRFCTRLYDNGFVVDITEQRDNHKNRIRKDKMIIISNMAYQWTILFDCWHNVIIYELKIISWKIFWSVFSSIPVFMNLWWKVL